MKVLVATDAWHPQVNGVVRTYECLAQEAVPLGFEVSFLAPCQFRTLPLPNYPEISLALAIAAQGAHSIAAQAAAGDWLLRGGFAIADPKSDNLDGGEGGVLNLDTATSVSVTMPPLIAV